jgi:hypothetical protein
MPRLAEKTAQYYGVRREVSQPADLATLLLARMLYDVPPKTPRPVLDLVRQLKGEPDAQPLEGVNQQRGGDVFKGWLRRYLMISETIKGTSFYPLHPALTVMWWVRGMT